MKLSTPHDPEFLRHRSRQEGARRIRERQAAAEHVGEMGVRIFPLPDSESVFGKVILLDESGYHFVVTNRAGEDTALVFSRCSYVIADPEGHLQYGPLVDAIFYPGPISLLVADLNSLCASTFGNRMPYRHADVGGFGEKVDARKILELISKNRMWAQVRSLYTSGKLSRGDIVLLDGSLNVVATPETKSADEIDNDLFDSGITLVGLSKAFGPKCADIVAWGRALYPGRAFIFTIPAEKILNAHSGADDNEMILRLGPCGRTLGLQFGIALSTDEEDLEYHGLYISYRHNENHRREVENGNVVKIYDPVELTTDFIEFVLIPLGTRLFQYAQGVISPNYPLPAGAVHSHVLFTAKDMDELVMPVLSGMIESGETLRRIECDSRQPHDPVDVILNRFYRR
jgi:hypothetical protein